ncbi:MAG: DUF4011 domain-containing protein [Myxococcaceae bacterium]|nr:DUF4011 domain-containing protein [Myxococcaceae bacterium]
MLERLYASLTSGPSLNCRPHNSRQRIDLTQLSKLDGTAANTIVAGVLSDAASVKLVGKARAPTVRAEVDPDGEATLSAEEQAALKAWNEQQALLRKLATIAEDARTFEQDTGAHALHIGFPLLHLPPGKASGRLSSTRRILAPLAFVPVRITSRTGRAPSIEISSVGEGVDRVMPNTGLLVWIQQQTGKKLGELFADENGSQPWREINDLAKAVCSALDLPAPADLGPDTLIEPTPRSDDDGAPDARSGLLSSAVLGLYPLSNQSLVEDMEALVEGEPLQGPIESFVRSDVSLGTPAGCASANGHAASGDFDLAEPEHLITHADPCQARAVRLARASRGLVIHGPPGTGKSQTIANIIGDHLARGQRVLFVCDKRTALDVVKSRLDALGLGGLCAVVHDAQRDQRDLYMGIREQLDALSETKPNAHARNELARVDAELRQIHDELRRIDDALARPLSDGGPSFHDLVGQWLGTRAVVPATVSLEGVRLPEVTSRERELRELFDRGVRENWPDNPWREAVGVDLAAWQSAPVAGHRQRLETLLEPARSCDATRDPRILPFSLDGNLEAEIEARERVARNLEAAIASAPAETIARWASASSAELEAAHAELTPALAQVDLIARGPLDAELALVHRSSPLSLAVVVQAISAVGAWLTISRKWYRWFCFGRKKAARLVLQRFGLQLAVDTAERVAKFLDGLRARQVVGDLHQRLFSAGAALASPAPDDVLVSSARAHQAVFELLAAIDTTPALAHIAAGLRERLRGDRAAHSELLEGLRASAKRGGAIGAFVRAMEATGLLSPSFRSELERSLRAGEAAEPAVATLLSRISSVEGILRIKDGLANLPAPVLASVRALADAGLDGEHGYAALFKAAAASELRARLKASPELQKVDPAGLEALHARYRALDDQRKPLVRDAILHLWTTRQKERLLASTGTRLNPAGAELKRRLMVRGQRVMRVRQMIAAGAQIEGGDPLFDVRPVWMASPETVAQIFPRAPLFDVLIFDESSQCRLEEALPVLLRARRVVIAGDPRQLPPTRFFESSVAQSTDEEPEGNQALFEAQQSEVEDLLSAALNLDIEQCYLDVHYRSRNADLIEFSNRNFYDARLQAIPGHPSNLGVRAPLRLVHVDGTYHKRVNQKEAETVVELVRELLSRPEPPSIGIACFNLSQREAILNALDAAAAEDPEFAARLAAARTRQGQDSFEGLFVKNLENVQGDERDHIIISTTYGPDPSGRFYRRFGPLAQAGGGRRLNVLVTRAREEVHLVTSIPPEVYRALPPIPDGVVPNGGWLLFAYLQFAEELEKAYAARRDEEADDARTEDGRKATVRTRPSKTESAWARALAKHLAQALGTSSDLYWGNEGFCVDLALRHPLRRDLVTVGVLCDGARFDKARDRVEWDVFRTRVLEGQGWRFVRLWSPHFFRDPESALQAIAKAAAENLAKRPIAGALEADTPGRRVLH